MPPFVVLLHSLPDGSSHFDWLIARPTAHLDRPDERSLLSFRTEHRPDVSDQFAAHPMPDHRVHYLTFEGHIEPDRGMVRRVATGLCHFTTLSPKHVRLTLQRDWPGVRIAQLDGRAGLDGLWVFDAVIHKPAP